MRSEIKFSDGDVLIFADVAWRICIIDGIKEAVRYNVFVTVIVHDLIPIFNRELVVRCKTLIFKRWLSVIYNLAGCFICISDSVKNDLYSYYEKQGWELKVPVDSFTLGADFNDCDSEVENISDELINIYKKNKNIYLAVGSIEPRKNYEYLIDNFDLLWSKNIDVSLCIVGRDIGLCSGLIKRINKHRLINRKFFLFNNMSDNDLIYCYNNSKAFVFASVVEGFGLPLIESLKCGLPVIASDIPVFREVGKDNILYFDVTKDYALGEKILKIERHIESLRYADSEEIKSNTWKESVETLLKKIEYFKMVSDGTGND